MVISSSLHALDSALSLLLTVLTASLSHPPTLAYAQVLLQTAPASSHPQMRSLRRTLKEITFDHRVLGLGTLRCWCINPSLVHADPIVPSSTHTPCGSIQSSPEMTGAGYSPSTSPTHADFSPIHPSTYPTPFGLELGGDTSLVVTLMVHVHSDVSDKDVLDITKTVWGKVNEAVRIGTGGGEVSIGVRRGWDGMGE